MRMVVDVVKVEMYGDGVDVQLVNLDLIRGIQGRMVVVVVVVVVMVTVSGRGITSMAHLIEVNIAILDIFQGILAG